MTQITTSARTVDQAIEKALYELGTTRDQVEVKVLDVGSEGLMGLLGLHRAKVQVTVRQESKTRALRFLEGLLEKMGVPAKVDARETRGVLWLDIALDGDGGLLIGHRGQTLQALQLLTERATGDDDGPRRIVVDVNRYIAGREDRLVQRARDLADKAIADGRPIRTEPLPDVERRIVHHTLRSDSRVETRSVGHGLLKPIVIMPRKAGEGSGERRPDTREGRRPEGRRRRRFSDRRRRPRTGGRDTQPPTAGQ